MNEFLAELKRVRNRWRLGLAGAALLDWIAWSLIALAGLCLLDLALALAPVWRCLAVSAAGGGVTLVAAIRGFRILTLGSREAAQVADGLSGSRRREALTAYELQRAPAPADSPLAAYFLAACGRQAVDRLRGIRSPFPAPVWRAAWRRLAIVLALVGAAVLASPRAAALLTARMLAPYADNPPFSRYRFAVTPEAPQVIYGADQEVAVTIGGPPVRDTVFFVTRQAGRTRETPCFQGSPTNFAQRLERVMQPVEFCFRTGKARSRWHRVTVLLEPHIEAATVRLTPPAYSRRPVRTFALGAEPLAGLRGSQVRLTVRSNRPLRDGILTVTPLDGITHAATESGVRQGANGMTFDWTIVRSARLSVMIRDLMGTGAREPLKTVVEALSDEAPRVSLQTPALFSLATPSVTVPIEGQAEDDLGLRRVDLYRGVLGYRSRGLAMEVEPDASSCVVSGRLDLAKLGVEPGQVLELVAEAADTNPDLSGIGASDVARIQIISEAEYAEMVRLRTTLEAFRERFEAVDRKAAELLKEIEAARAGMKDGRLDDVKAADTMRELQRKGKELAGGLRELAGAFAAYDLEKKLASTAADMAGTLEQALARPGWEGGDAAARQAALDACLAAMGRGRKEIGKLAQQAAETEDVAQVMACAAWFRALVDRQELLVRRLERYAAGDREGIDPAMLARTQTAIREQLEALQTKLDKRANRLPDAYEPLRTSALDFLWRLRSLEVPPTMEECVTACRNEKARESWTHGIRALEKLRAMLGQCKGTDFGGLCDGALRFKVPGDLGPTLAQLLKALTQQFGAGVGQGAIGAAGLGLAGSTEGSSQDGYSGVDVPVYGPERRQPFPVAGQGGRGPGEGAGRAGEPGKRDVVGEVLRGEDRKEIHGEGLKLETVPLRYREAVKAFYREDAE